MTVAELRAILADAPDDAPVRVNLSHVDGSARNVTAGEYLDRAQWHDEAGIFLQIAKNVPTEGELRALWGDR